MRSPRDVSRIPIRPARTIALACVLALGACERGAEPRPTTGPRGVVLVVGDGMGAAHVTLARLLRGERFRLGELPHVGLVATRSASSLVTDSAAAATALATGVPTRNGFLGLDADGVARRTVLELAELRGLATGIVTTAHVADATPAAFTTHHRDRNDGRALTAQLVRCGADVLVGGGLEAYGVEVAPLAELAAVGGYQVATTADELPALAGGPALVALRSGAHGGDSPDARLSELAGWALERVAANPEGFFLLVEHEGIDTASHHGESAALEASLRSFDETVGVVLDAAARTDDILVVVLGDHETGGLRIHGEPGAPQLAWTTDGHTGEAVPIFATGPGADAFARSLDHAEVGRALHAIVGAIGSAP